MHNLTTTLTTLLKNEDGATAIEYGLIAALISIAALSAFQLIGPALLAKFTLIANALQ
jgi:pilus assembly protein Flp/PilA